MENREWEEKKRRRAERQRQEDKALSHVLLWVVGAILLELLLFLVKNHYCNFEVTDGGIALAGAIGSGLGWARFVGLGLGIGGLVWALLRTRKGKEGPMVWALSVFMLAVGIFSVLIYANTAAVEMLIYLTPVAVLLAMVYLLYRQEFFLVALTCAVTILGIWLILREGGANLRTYVVAGGLGVILLALVLFLRVLQRKGGSLTWGGRPRTLLGKRTNYALLYVTCGLMALSLLAAVLVGPSVAATIHYAAPVAWLLIMAVYYTVRLM